MKWFQQLQLWRQNQLCKSPSTYIKSLRIKYHPDTVMDKKGQYSHMSTSSEASYTPTQIGVEVRGIDLNCDLSKDLIEKIKTDVHKHRLLIFKDQGVVSGERHVQISKWFGEIESTFYKHSRSPHPDVFRVSNAESEGCRNVGRTGWHIDGSFMEEPFDFAVYHMVSVPKTGSTAFIGFEELVNSLRQDQLALWKRLWMVGNNRDVIHPLIYSHPVTQKPVLCFHLGMIDCFVWDYGSKSQKMTDRKETLAILQEIYREIVKDNESLVYKHEWKPGDFIISDNRAVGHEATPETQLPVSEVGLRVLHRTTVKGSSRPSK